jgi:hypothetical protein
MDMFWNKQLCILKSSYTYKSQVLQRFLGFIIPKTIIKFVQYGLRIFAGFVHSGILLIQSIWWILKMRGSVRRRLWRMNMWRRTMLKRLFSWWVLKRGGSVRRRLQRMTMWRRTLMRSLFNWWILKRRGSVRWRPQRMNM